jgi:hypothetical protein
LTVTFLCGISVKKKKGLLLRAYCFFGRTFFGFGATFAARRDLNFSTRPAVSMSFSSPV